MNPEDGMSQDARAFLDDFLADGPDADGPTARDRARVRRVVMASVTTTSVALAASTGASSAAASSATAGGGTTLGGAAGFSLGAKLLTAVVVVGAVGGGAVATTQLLEMPAFEAPETNTAALERSLTPSSERRVWYPAPPVIASPEAALEPGTHRVVEIAVTPTQSQRTEIARAPVAARRREAAAPEPTVSNMAEELRLLRAAQAALGQADYSSALASVHEHRRRFPAGSLRAESEATGAIAACASAPETGRSAASSFLRDHPGHPLADRVRTACH